MKKLSNTDTEAKLKKKHVLHLGYGGLCYKKSSLQIVCTYRWNSYFSTVWPA